MTDWPIDSHIPCPRGAYTGQGRAWGDRLSKMKVGDSIFYSLSSDPRARLREESAVRISALRVGRRLGFKFISRADVTNGVDGLRLWRVEGSPSVPRPRKSRTRNIPAAEIAVPAQVREETSSYIPKPVSRFDRIEYVEEEPSTQEPLSGAQPIDPPEEPDLSFAEIQAADPHKRAQHLRRDLSAQGLRCNTEGEFYSSKEWEELGLQHVVEEITRESGRHFKQCPATKFGVTGLRLMRFRPKKKQ